MTGAVEHSLESRDGCPKLGMRASRAGGSAQGGRGPALHSEHAVLLQLYMDYTPLLNDITSAA